MARAFKLTAAVVREWPLHKQIADTLRLEIAPAGRVSADGVVWWSIDAADFGGSVPATRMGRGIIAGCPDLFVLHLGLAAFIEIKAADGIVSDAQKAVASAVLSAGGRVGVARDAIEVLACIDRWQIPRSRRTALP